jgi:thiamine pyrophosphokinase
MSSHHVVREKQEPALLVLGLDNFADDLLGQLLEWSPTVITTPETAEQLNAFGIKIDWIIAGAANEDMQSDVKIIPQGVKELITTTALNYLVTQGYPAVNIITDCVNLDDYLPFAEKIDLVVLIGNKRIFTVHNGFSKWKPAGESIEILSGTDNLQIGGLENTAPNRYKTKHDGFYTLQFNEPFLFIAEEIS